MATKKIAQKKSTTPKKTATKRVTVPQPVRETPDEYQNIVTSKTFNWEAIPTGAEFTATATYSNMNIKGKIFNNTEDKEINLCYTHRDSDHDTHSPESLGYKSSLQIDYTLTTEEELEDECFISKLIITPPPAGFIPPVIIPKINDYKVEIEKGQVKVGCTYIDNETVRLIAENLKD